MNSEPRLLGQLISESVAVFIIILLGDSVAAMYLLYDPNPYAGSYWGVCITWGLAVTLAIYATASVSGTHANPAVTAALWLFRGFPGKRVLPYCVAQVLGGALGAAVVYFLFLPVINDYNTTHGILRDSAGGARSASVFFTHAGHAITTWHAFGDEIVLTALLVFGIFAITERFNSAAPQANLGALMIGLLVAAIGASAGYLEAFAINPARDLGPRIFTYLVGWGSQAFPSPNSYWWVPIAGPLIGGPLGAFAYQVLIFRWLPERQAAQ